MFVTFPDDFTNRRPSTKVARRVEIRSNRNNKRRRMKRGGVKKKNKNRRRGRGVYPVSTFILSSGLLHRRVSIQLLFFSAWNPSPLSRSPLGNSTMSAEDRCKVPLSLGERIPLGPRAHIAFRRQTRGQRTLKSRPTVSAVSESCG